MSHFICIIRSVIVHLLRDFSSFCINKTSVSKRSIHVHISGSYWSLLRRLDLVSRSLKNRRLRPPQNLLIIGHCFLILCAWKLSFRLLRGDGLCDWMVHYRLKCLSSFKQIVRRFWTNQLFWRTICIKIPLLNKRLVVNLGLNINFSRF